MQTDCIEHTQSVGRQRYGFVCCKGKTQYMHRVVYCTHNGTTLEAIKGLVVRHTCDNKRCINPAHLLIGTHKDNYNDARVRGRLNLRTGDAMAHSKLSKDIAEEIRKVYVPRSKLYGARALARKYGVAHSTIVRTVGGERWIR